jgi:methyltransferase
MSHGHALYAGFVGAAVLLAVAERRHAARNERRLRGEGAEEIAPRVFLAMVPIYSLGFASALAENLLLDREPPGFLVVAMLALFLAAKILKLWAVRHLGDFWTMRVFVPRVIRVAADGPYRFLRHPNYVAVMAEVLALPLAGGAFITALVTGGCFAVLLAWRVRTEEAALLAHPEYAERMEGRNRFLPGRGR